MRKGFNVSLERTVVYISTYGSILYTVLTKDGRSASLVPQITIPQIFRPKKFVTFADSANVTLCEFAIGGPNLGQLPGRALVITYKWGAAGWGGIVYFYV
jgi:hypothetical protein